MGENPISSFCMKHNNQDLSYGVAGDLQTTKISSQTSPVGGTDAGLGLALKVVHETKMDPDLRWR